MRYALISDIHANLPALEAVLDGIGARPETAAIHHLGDLVGYGPWPNETIALLKGFRISGIQGNHDAKGGTTPDPGRASPAEPLDPGAWTAAETTPANRGLLASLPFRMDLRPHGGHLGGPTVILLHGTATASDEYWFEDHPAGFFRDQAALLRARVGDVVCCGHTHLPWHREVDGIHFVNTGSVGRPKDGDWRAGYVVLDMSGTMPAVEFVRVEYDLERAVEAIRASPLPDEFAEYLRTGGGGEQVNG